jgi:hypothetical protein
MIEEKSRAPGSLTGFFVILTSFVTIYLLSWPVLFSFYLWVFADRSSFLNLDYLLHSIFAWESTPFIRTDCCLYCFSTSCLQSSAAATGR